AVQVLDPAQFAALVLPSREEAVALLRGGAKGVERWQLRSMSWENLPAPVDLSGGDLRGARFREVNFQSANFDGADLRGADLTYCQFDKLRGVNAEGACLRNAFVQDATDCNFRGADLTEAHINPAVFTRCDFRGARMRKLFGGYTRATEVVFADAD